MHLSKNKTATAIALFLMFAMAFSLFALPTISAQDLYVRIRGPEKSIVNEEALIRLEVRDSTGRIAYAWQDAMLGVKYPGRADFTWVGPYSTPSTGRDDIPVLLNETGTFALMWMVPAQGPLPPNPGTPDGEWYSEILLISVVEELTAMTYPYIGAMPNPVGVSQEVLLHVGISQQLRIVGLGWTGLKITVERPDGVTEMLGPFTTDSTGGTGTVYVPTMTGTYYLQTHFPEQVMPESVGAFAAGTVMKASTSEKLALIVQEEPVERHPGYTLPAEYWTRPIDAQLREWYTISGSQLYRDANRFYPYNDDAPEAPHVLWTKPLTIGGLAGGERDDHAFECGDAYEGKWPGAITLAGLLYYTKGGSRGLEPVVTHCVNLHTGEELWSKIFLDNRTISFGQLFYWDSYNFHGVFGYLWVTVGTTWYAYDAWSGDWRYTIENVPSGTTLYGPKGEFYRLQINDDARWMALWNSSALGSMQGSWGNTVHMRTLDAAANTPDAKRAWAWNATIPRDLPGSVVAAGLGDKVVGVSTSSTIIRMWGLSLKEGQEGVLLFNRTWTVPPGDITMSTATASLEDGVFTLRAKELRAFYGFSTETGEYVWGPTESRPYLDLFMGGPSGERGIIAYGKLFLGTMAGVLQCIDVKTGDLLWNYTVEDPYTEILWSNNWPIEFGLATDGKIYLFHTEHSVIDPKPRGAPFICLNATTGEEIFRVDGLIRATVWGGDPVIGDSIIVQMNTYDQRMYAIGKGPSATTVTAAPKVSVYGSNVLVEGMVTDVSPGTEDYALTARFPNGVPAVADENMSEWMKYVYKQFPRPTDATGVEVVVSVLDPNNNSYEVGRTTSDASGMFKLMFTPEVPGEYTVIATFEGSKSYYGSFAETAFGVEEAPQSTPAPTPTPAPITDMYVMGFGIGIIIAIVIVGLLLVLLLRKR